MKHLFLLGMILLSLLSPTTSLAQSGQGILTVQNNSRTAICYVVAIPGGAATEVVEEMFHEAPIAQGQSGQVFLPAGLYALLLTDCDIHLLYMWEFIDLSEPFTLTYDERTVQAFELESQGIEAYRAGQFAEALDYFLQNLAIVQEINDRSGEAQVLGYIGGIYTIQGLYAPAQEYLELAIERHQEIGDRGGEGDTLNSLGYLYNQLGQYEEALAIFEQSLSIRRELNDRVSEGVVLNNIGDVYHTQEQLETARDYYDEALAIARETGNRAGEGTVLVNIGVVLKDQGDYAAALDHFEQGLAIMREVRDRIAEGKVMINIGGTYEAMGDYDQALVYYQQGLTLLERSGNAGEIVLALTQLAALYEIQEDYDSALEYFQQALTLTREMENRQKEGYTLMRIGVIYQTRTDYEAALGYYQQALFLAQETGDTETENIAYNNLGMLYYEQAQYDQALDYSQNALDVAREEGDLTGQSIALNNIGLIYAAQWNHDLALDSYQQALDVLDGSGDQDHYAKVFHNIGQQYRALGQHAQALDYFQRALEIRQEIGDREGESDSLNNIGQVYDAQGQYETALDFYQRALEIRQEIGYLEGAGDSLGNIGGIYYELGEYDQAIEYFEQDLALRREIEDKAGEDTSLNSLGLTYYALEDYDRARTYFEEALAIAEESGDAQGKATILNNIGLIYDAQEEYSEAFTYFRQSLTIEQQISDPLGAIVVLGNLADVTEAMGDLDLAIDYYKQAVELIEEIHTEIGLEGGQLAFGSIYSNVRPYDRLVALQASLNPVEAFTYAERGRARTFLAQLNREAIPFGTGADAEMLTSWQAKRDELASLRRQRVELASQLLPPAEGLREVDAAIMRVESELERLTEQIALQNPRLSQVTSITIPDLAGIQAAIPEDSTLLSYYFTDEDVYVFILNSTDFMTILLPVSAEEVRHTVETFRSDELTQAAALTQLYDWLLMPVVAAISTPKLIIAPHDVLNYVPFAALQDEQGGYLLDSFGLSYTPSATIYTVLNETRSTPPASGTPLIIGNPATSLPPLPFAEQEALEVAGVLGVQGVVGDNATEQLFRNSVGNADIIHLATHGSFNPLNPLSSFLAFTPDPDNDGLLEAREIYALPLKEHAPLVVLSACQTAVGELTGGDDFQGLTRAFLLSGARAVVASLWSVDDRATSALMVEFYRNRAAGMSDAEALAAAQQAIRSDPDHPEWQSPYYWAAFVIVGVEA